MTKLLPASGLLLMAPLLFTLLGLAQDGAAPESKAPPQTSPFREPAYAYIGLKQCKLCHSKEKLGGEEFQLWEKGPHAKAFATLKGDAAKAIAKEKGLGDPWTEDACVKCHTIAHGVDAKWVGKDVTKEEGVSCEACHGPGDGYKGRKVMLDHEASLKAGLVIPNETTCRSCHNPESPTYREFDYAERLKTIRHWKDKAEKAGGGE